MIDTPRRSDTWIQWALVLLVLLGAFWNLSGRLARIEQAMTDDASFHNEETQRILRLEQDLLAHGLYK